MESTENNIITEDKIEKVENTSDLINEENKIFNDDFSNSPENKSKDFTNSDTLGDESIFRRDEIVNSVESFDGNKTQDIQSQQNPSKQVTPVREVIGNRQSPADIHNSNNEIQALESKLRDLKAEKYKKIDLVKTDVEGIKIGIRKDGRKYSVRDDRGRFFYPSEWMKFFDNLNDKQKFTFSFLINTGCRINEARHVRVGDIDLDNKRILVRITKIKAKKGEKNHKPRTIPISSQFAKYIRGVFRDNNLTNEYYLASSNNPKDDEMPENPKLFKGGILSNPGGHLALKKNLKDVGIKDWKNFSIHNIRKSLETWMVALNIDGMKITAHIGHDLKTAAQHYVSADVFSFEEKKQMRLIIGDLYQQQF